MPKALSKFRIVNAVTMTANITSSVVPIEFLSCAAIQANWTGTPVGTFSVQVSMDYEQDNLGNVINAGNWNSLTLSVVTAAGGAAGSVYINLANIAAPYVRLFYTFTSSTGTLNAFACGKETS